MSDRTEATIYNHIRAILILRLGLNHQELVNRRIRSFLVEQGDRE